MSFSHDLENWMAKLPICIRDKVPLINLAIPGSHDSGSYGISGRSRIAPDAENIIRKLFPFVPCVIRRWSKTQQYSIEDQLNNGIRYLDLRVASNASNDKLYFVHALFCEEITEPFEDLLGFLQKHPKEVVILDFQHFYDFSSQHHIQLISFIMKLFDGKIFVRSLEESNLIHLTLSGAYKYGKQMVVIYRNSTFTSDKFFRSYDFPTPWPNATKIEDLKEILEKRLTTRTPMIGFVQQVLLTPDANFILPRFYSTLRKKCAKKVDSLMTDWIKEQSPGMFKDGDKPLSNVFLADFVDIKNNNFSKTVIDLNMKLDVS